jgi:hypothetical protein
MSNNSIKNIILKSGAQLVGAGAGAGAKDLLMALPGGNFINILGETVGALVENILVDYSERTLSTREKEKIGAALIFAADKIKARLDKNHKFRSDDKFFSNNENYRSSSQEALEGILIKSRLEHEDRKVKHLGYIYANSVFEDISISQINFFIKLAEKLSYIQYCLISKIFQKNEPFRRDEIAFYDENLTVLLQEINELYQLGLIQMLRPRPGDGDFLDGGIFKVSPEGEFQPISSWDDIRPDRVVLTKLGKLLYSIMSLDEIPKDDQETVIKILK